MDETQKTLDEFWNKHAAHLKLCLQLRQYELDFRELQVWTPSQFMLKKPPTKHTQFLFFSLSRIVRVDVLNEIHIFFFATLFYS